MKSSSNVSVDQGINISTYNHFVQVYSDNVSGGLKEHLSSETFAREEQKVCADGKSRLVWAVEIEVVRTVYQKYPQSQFDIWQSKDGEPLEQVTVELREKIFNPKPKKARIRGGSRSCQFVRR